MKEAFVEIKIGIQNTARELSLESNQSSEEVEAAVAAAFKDRYPEMVVLEGSGATAVESRVVHKLI